MSESQPPTQREPPGTARQIWNLAEAVAGFISDGMKLVSEDEYRHRLEICDGCDRRQGNTCLECGCRLQLKARGRAFQCPLDKWPSLNTDQSQSHDPSIEE